MNGQIDWVELFFSSTGRVARTPFLIAAAVLIAIAMVYETFGLTVHLLTGWVVYPALIFTTACVLSKRLHDRGRSGWLAAIIILALIVVWPVPAGFLDFAFALVIVWAAVELGVMGSEQGANRYGPNPMKTATV